MIYKQLNGTIQDTRDAEDTMARTAKNEALLAYLAVMTGVEIPTDDESEANLNE